MGEDTEETYQREYQVNNCKYKMMTQQVYLQPELLTSVPPSLFAAATGVGNTESLLSATSAAAVVDWLQATVGNKCQKQHLTEGCDCQAHLNKEQAMFSF